MFAYKGFNKNLECTMGKGVFKYEIGKWYKEDSAHCCRDGFHATDNPLDVLAYYNKPDDRYFIVELAGNVDEDAVNSRISAPEIRLVKEITRAELYGKGVMWMINHPHSPNANVVRKDKGDCGGDGYLVVRGMSPVAKGKNGDTLFLLKEDSDGAIIAASCFVVGIDVKPNVFVNIKGEKAYEKVGTVRA